MLTYLTKSSTYPVTLAEAKAHLRVDGTDEDTYISSLIAVATELIEAECNIDLRPVTAKLTICGFPPAITIPRIPLTAITSVKYYDGSNTQQTLSASAYSTGMPSNSYGWVVPKALTIWPSTYPRWDAVEITFASGYTTAPTMAKHAILLAVGTWYENRENESELRLNSLGIGFERLTAMIRGM